MILSALCARKSSVTGLRCHVRSTLRTQIRGLNNNSDTSVPARAPLSGFATALGTEKRRALLKQSHPHKQSSSTQQLVDWVPSRLGFGAFRAFDLHLHAPALATALRSGVNLINTSPSYRSGASEIFIGNVLHAMIGEGELTREEVIIVTKVDCKNQAALKPEAIVSSLTASLARLGLDCIDALLLQFPERALVGCSTEITNQLMVEAFHQLELEVQKGRIKCYGVCSNVLRSAISPSSDTLEISLVSLLEAAKSSADRGSVKRNHFSLVQVPLNLLESNAWFPSSVDQLSLLAAARRAGLVTFTERPLNALSHSVLLRLVDARSHEGSDIAQKVKEAWDYCGFLERIYASLWDKDDTRDFLQQVSAPPVEELSWAQVLAFQSRALDLYGWREVRESVVWPRVEATLLRLAECDANETTAKSLKLADLAHNYRRSLRAAFDLLDGLHERNRHFELRALREVIGLDNEGYAPPALSHTALNFAFSGPSDSVLVGMRSMAQVKDTLESLQISPLDDESAKKKSAAARIEASRICQRYELAQKR